MGEGEKEGKAWGVSEGREGKKRGMGRGQGGRERGKRG